MPVQFRDKLNFSFPKNFLIIKEQENSISILFCKRITVNPKIGLKSYSELIIAKIKKLCISNTFKLNLE